MIWLILQFEYGGDNSRVIGVYSSKEKADSEVNRFQEIRRELSHRLFDPVEISGPFEIDKAADFELGF